MFRVKPDSKLTAVISGFDFTGSFIECEEIKTGHINRTYGLRFALPDGGESRYVLQRINDFAFKKPAEVMHNVRLVTEHLRRATLAQGLDPARRVLRLIPARDGEFMLVDAEGGSWRAYDYISGAVTVDRVDGPEQFREIGAAFGDFQTMLADFPIGELYDTIPHFHDTRQRLRNFEASLAADVKGRAASLAAEIAFVRERRDAMCRIVDMVESGEIPLRVTHNDTKINNVMLDGETGEALCVVDLDTVMAGSALYDYGDAIRYGACTADEDERDLARVALDLELYAGFSEGFISRTARGLTHAELVNLPLGALVMTYENGVRFLTDYLDGDVYFRIERPEHNLDRARCQFRLLRDMEAKRERMDAIALELIGRYR